MTWTAIFRRLLFLLRANRSWRRGVRLPECSECGHMLEETVGLGPWICLLCKAEARRAAEEQQKAQSAAFFAMPLSDHKRIMALQAQAQQVSDKHDRAEYLLQMQNAQDAYVVAHYVKDVQLIPNPYLSQLADQQQTQKQAGRIGSALGNMLGGLLS